MAPLQAVLNGRAPTAHQRDTTSARGKCQGLWSPAEKSTNRGRVAATQAGVDEVALPWCPATTRVAASALPQRLASPSSTGASASPLSSATPRPLAMRNTQEASLPSASPLRGLRISNRTPSHHQVSPARQGTAPGPTRRGSPASTRATFTPSRSAAVPPV